MQGVSKGIGAPELRRALVRYVRARVPPADVEDIVQNVLCDACTATSRAERRELTRWVMGIARHKVADLYRETAARGRVVRRQAATLPAPLYDGDVAAAEWLDWAEARVRGDAGARSTLRWMARESEGEKLAHIAEQERIPKDVVRQRVSRLRRRMRGWYAAELAAIVVVVSVGVALRAAWLQVRDEPSVSAAVVAEQSDPLVVEHRRVAFDWRARGFTCEIMVDAAGTSWTEQTHGHEELIMVLEGELEIEVEGTRRRLLVGEEFRVTQGREHSVRTLGDSGARWLYGFPTP